MRSPRIDRAIARGLLHCAAVLMLLLASGCLQIDVATCADGTICPENSVCVPSQSGVCATQEQITACIGGDGLPKTDGAACTFSGLGGLCKEDRCVVPGCGNDIIDPGEQCDDGAANSSAPNAHCRTTCQFPSCGDGIVDDGEACDDGNQDNTDACLSTCKIASCGDGFVQAGVDGCDDGNLVDGDGCSATCAVEPGWKCASPSGGASVCSVAQCGDGIRAGDEACDDGNQDNTDACLNTCKLATCGDGFVEAGVDGCDDGNLVDGDGCSATCMVEPGWNCASGSPSVCGAAQCGDGIPAGAEACDDGNHDDGDGCSATCTVEPGWNCASTSGGASVCTVAECGDGIRVGAEECDDGNQVDFDGCSTACTIEAGWTCTTASGAASVCGAAECGDGIVAGAEECDNGSGNSLSPDALCRPDCQKPKCGDGVVSSNDASGIPEACDDGNLDNFDGCSNACVLEQQLLNLVVLGPGTVTSDDGAISACSGNCFAFYPSSLNTVTLTATATAGDDFGFLGWSGACAGSTPLCVLSPGQQPSTAVIASFGYRVGLTNEVPVGSGTLVAQPVNPAGTVLACTAQASSCEVSEFISPGATLNISVTPDVIAPPCAFESTTFSIVTPSGETDVIGSPLSIQVNSPMTIVANTPANCN